MKQELLFTELDGGASAYSIGKHRHVAEMEQELNIAANEAYKRKSLLGPKEPHAVFLDFTPHLVPMTRGMLATIHVNTASDPNTAAQTHDALTIAYANEPFVQILPLGQSASTHQVRGTNQCFISVHAGRTGGLIIISVIDNLVKGASGQALQNANLMFGLPETTNLELTAMFP